MYSCIDIAGTVGQQKGLPRPTSMLFDLEMEESCSTPNQLEPEAQQAAEAVSLLVSQAFSLCREVVQNVQAACQVLLANGVRVSTARLAQLLSGSGYSVQLRESVGGGVGNQCLRNLHHSCLMIKLQHKSSPQRSVNDSIIVDPTFGEQFAIAHPTRRYAAVLESLPAVFVGPISAIPPLVELLCTEMSLAFDSMGIVLPPWRYTKSMLSKWQPRRSVELNLHAAGCSLSAATAPTICIPHHQQQQEDPTAASTGCYGSRPLQDCRGSNSSCATVHLTNSTSSSSSISSISSKQQGCRDTASAAGMASSGTAINLSADTRSCSAAAGNALPRAGVSSAQRHSDVSDVCGDLYIHSTSHAERRASYEPLQRVVGGFAVSMTAQSPLVQ